MPVLGLAGCHGQKWKLLQARRLASQSVSPDQMDVFVGSGPKWSAATPRVYIYIYIASKRSLTSIQTVHTHTPCLRQGGARNNEMKMRMSGGWKMRWEWRWDERYLTRTRRGERKRRRKEKTHTNTPGPERANPERQGKRKKRRVDGHGPRPAEGGGRRKRLNQPDTARTYKHLSTRRSQPTWGGRRAWDRGPMGN